MVVTEEADETTAVERRRQQRRQVFRVQLDGHDAAASQQQQQQQSSFLVVEFRPTSSASPVSSTSSASPAAATTTITSMAVAPDPEYHTDDDDEDDDNEVQQLLLQTWTLNNFTGRIVLKKQQKQAIVIGDDDDEEEEDHDVDDDVVAQNEQLQQQQHGELLPATSVGTKATTAENAVATIAVADPYYCSAEEEEKEEIEHGLPATEEEEILFVKQLEKEKDRKITNEPPYPRHPEATTAATPAIAVVSSSTSSSDDEAAVASSSPAAAADGGGGSSLVGNDDDDDDDDDNNSSSDHNTIDQDDDNNDGGGGGGTTATEPSSAIIVPDGATTTATVKTPPPLPPSSSTTSILKTQQRSSSDNNNNNNNNEKKKRGMKGGILFPLLRKSPPKQDEGGGGGDGDDKGPDAKPTSNNSVTIMPGEVVDQSYGANKIPARIANKLKAMPRTVVTGFGLLDNTKGATPDNGDDDGDSLSPSSKTHSKWGALATLMRAKRKIPSKVRAKRLGSLTVGGIREPPPTRLHSLCADPDVTLEQLQEAFAAEPGAVEVSDASTGRLPLHVLGENDKLMEEPIGRATVKAFAWQLMVAYPEGITTPDTSGFMPFVSLIRDWETWVYESCINSEGSSISPSGIMNRVTGFVTENTSKLTSSARNTITSTTSRGSSASQQQQNTSTTSASTSLAKLFPQVEIWSEVEFCFEMLSFAMDELGGKNGGLYKVRIKSLDESKIRDNEARGVLATHICSVLPTVLKTILLIEEDGGEIRRSLLKTSIIRRCFLCPESVGRWLTTMIQTTGLPSRRAIDYLILVSKTTVHDYAGDFRSPILPDDTLAFEDCREETFMALDGLPGIVVSLVSLDTSETERAASTSVLWYIMNKNLSRPFVLSLVLIDLVLHITLLLAFRTDVSIFVGFEEARTDLVVPTQTVYFIVAHYIIRKVCESLAVLNISFSVFQSFFLNLWTLFDLAAIVLTLIAMSWNAANEGSYRNGLNALVIGLLWLKVLGFLKVVNKEMSTFILALLQILWDLRFFALVLIIVIFMFADMMRIAITNKDDGLYCVNMTMEEGDLEGPLGDFCSPDSFASNLRVYALLLGDFELDNYKEPTGLLVLFVIFTLIGVIILLNVLIAVVSDSYERAKIGSGRLFARARVLFVAQNQALESFLQPGMDPIKELTRFTSPGKALVGGVKVLRWTVLLSLFVTAFSAEIFLATKSVDSIVQGHEFLNLVLMMLLFIVLTLALWVLFIFTVGNALRGCLSQCGHRILDVVDRYTFAFVRVAASALFGLSKDVKTTSALSDDEDDTGGEEWSCRVLYMEHQFEKIVNKARDEVKDEILASEKRIYDHEELEHIRRQKEVDHVVDERNNNNE